MGLFEHFPYTNIHELNLDWILKVLKEQEATINNFVRHEAIKYANPLLWNITSQYEPNTIVIEPDLGDAYLSIKPVPAGVNLKNSEYWTLIFNYIKLIPAGTQPPVMDGAASPGTARAFSHEDHVHPTDTTKVSYDHADNKTEQEKMLARDNIGAADNAEVIKKTAQTLSNEERAQVRQNLDVPSRSEVTSPFNFKGSCTYAELPPSGTLNDTWYVTDRQYRMTWNGTAWYQSSLDESDYEDELTELNNDIDQFKNDVAKLIIGDQIFNKNDVTVGYLANDTGQVHTGGSYDESSYTNGYIDVGEHTGETIYCAVAGSSYNGMRTIVAYDSDKNLLSDKGASNRSEYVIPDDVSYLKLTIYNNVIDKCMISYDETMEYENYFDPYYAIDAAKLSGMVNITNIPIMELIKSSNRLDISKLTYGKYVHPDNGGLFDNANYATSDYMEVEEGETYTLQQLINTESITHILFLAGYNKNKEFINGSGATTVNYYTVPDRVKYVRISARNFVDYPERKYSFVKSIELVPYTDYFDDFYAVDNSFLQMEQIVKTVREAIVEAPKSIAKCDRLSIANVGDLIEIDVPNCKKSNALGFHANFDTFGSLQIGQGRTLFGATGYVVIDDTDIKVYAYEAGLVEKLNEPHNLTFTNYIDVIIEKPNDELIYGKIIVSTNGGTYIKDNVWLRMADRTAYAEVLSGSYTDMSLTYTATDFKCDVWAFGDSYFDHWINYILTAGYTNFYCDAFSGRNSANAMISLETALKHYTPKEILWCMGMNDGDSVDAVNASWKLNYNKLIDICEKNNIVPILCTIPNTPTINNEFKNEIIRESEHRYIDLAAAVGSDISTSWFNGLLSSDNVHPSTEGDKMIANFMKTQIPEIKG